MAVAAGSSLVWEYFSKQDSEKAKCSLCESVLQRKGGNTTGMKRHLKRYHEINFPEDNESKSKKGRNTNSESQSTTSSSAKTISSQPTLFNYVRRTDKLSTKSDKSKAITLSIAKMIFKDLQPVSLVEDIGFRETMGAATDERFVIPSRKTFRNNILPGLYHTCAQKVRERIIRYRSQFGFHAKYSITTDCWTSNQTTPFVTYTLHLVNDSPSGLSVDSYVLATTELAGKHTAINLRKHIFKTLSAWGLFGNDQLDVSNTMVLDETEISDTDEEDVSNLRAEEVGLELGSCSRKLKQNC